MYSFIPKMAALAVPRPYHKKASLQAEGIMGQHSHCCAVINVFCDQFDPLFRKRIESDVAAFPR